MFEAPFSVNSAFTTGAEIRTLSITIGFPVTLFTGYRQHYAQRIAADPDHRGVPLAPGQDYVIVIASSR